MESAEKRRMLSSDTHSEAGDDRGHSHAPSSGRLGLVSPKLAEKKDAEKVERELMQIVPEEDWTLFSNFIYYLGQGICTAKKPMHEECPVLHLCPTGQAALEHVEGEMPE